MYKQGLGSLQIPQVFSLPGVKVLCQYKDKTYSSIDTQTRQREAVICQEMSPAIVPNICFKFLFISKLGGFLVCLATLVTANTV